MGATSDNYEIVTGGTTYTIASDYVNPFGGETAHFQIVKAVYGTGDSVTNISSDTPLPVQPFGAWSRYEYLATSGYYGLASTIVGFTGNPIQIEGVCGGNAVGITGTITVVATDLDTRLIQGGTVGDGVIAVGDDYLRIQGISGGYAVGITTNNPIPVTFPVSSSLPVYGVSGATAVGVTFSTVSIRGLTAVSDTITVYGGGTASTVSVGLFGFTGATASPIYAEDNALNVNIKSSSGITVSASNLDIRDLDDATDSVTAVGEGALDQTGLKTVPTYINGKDANGNLIQIGGITGAGWSAGALNVYLVNNGITFTVSATATFSSQIEVTATASNPLQIQGSTYATSGVWVVGNTAGGAVVVQGNSGGYLAVEVSQFPELYNLLNNNVGNLDKNLSETKSNTDFLIGMKKALFASNISVSPNDYPDDFSIYNQVKTNVGDRLAAIQGTIVPAGEAHSTQNSLAVNVTKVKRVASFMSRTGFVGNTPVNLTSYNGAQGFTCEMGVRIKVSRVPSGANSSQNEIMCVISEADAAVYGASSVAASYVMYHGDEMFFEVDNIDKIKVFYPALSASNAPSNTASGLTFSFYAS